MGRRYGELGRLGFLSLHILWVYNFDQLTANFNLLFKQSYTDVKGCGMCRTTSSSVRCQTFRDNRQALQMWGRFWLITGKSLKAELAVSESTYATRPDLIQHPPHLIAWRITSLKW